MWPHRERFRELVKTYRLAQGITLAQTAKRLGLEESTLKDYLYRQTVKPSIAVLQKAAAIFGCSVLELVDDPGAHPIGALPNTSEFDRFMLRAMGSDLEALTDEQKVAAFEAWKATMKALKARQSMPMAAETPTPYKADKG